MARPRLTPHQLREILDYDPITGALKWKKRGAGSFRCSDKERQRVASRWSKNREGKEAGTVRDVGYRVICIEGRTYQAHRIAFAIVTGEWPEGQIDHINHVRDDNRWSNLRDVSASGNARNRTTPSHNTSGFVGVHYHKGSGSFHARIWDGQRRVHIGSFPTAKEAVAARIRAQNSYGYHENHGT